MAYSPLPSSDILRQRLDYDPESGQLLWKTGRRKGLPAFSTMNDQGYLVGQAGGGSRRVLKAHRIAWVIYHGREPNGQIDHVNGDKSDNRIANLRDVSQEINQRNVGRTANNTSGCAGVYWHARDRRWRATIMVDGKHISLGGYPDKEGAVEARKQAQLRYGFTDRHGA